MSNAMPGQSHPLSQHWTDILPLMPPHSITVWLLISSALLLGLVILAVYVLWQQRPRQRALRVLQGCARQLQDAPGDARRIAHTVHRNLLQGLGLSPASALRESHKRNQQWQAFYRSLQQCAFQAQPPATEELAGLIRQACDWLRHGTH